MKISHSARPRNRSSRNSRFGGAEDGTDGFAGTVVSGAPPPAGAGSGVVPAMRSATVDMGHRWRVRIGCWHSKAGAAAIASRLTSHDRFQLADLNSLTSGFAPVAECENAFRLATTGCSWDLKPNYVETTVTT
jgi:hypothetical protein